MAVELWVKRAATTIFPGIRKKHETYVAGGGGGAANFYFLGNSPRPTKTSTRFQPWPSGILLHKSGTRQVYGEFRIVWGNMPNVGLSGFRLAHLTRNAWQKISRLHHLKHNVPLDIKGCICHFVEWQIHPFISKGSKYLLKPIVVCFVCNFSQYFGRLTIRRLLSTTVDIMCFYYHLYNQLLKVKYAFNLETLIYVGI